MAIGCGEPSQFRNLEPFPGHAEKRRVSDIRSGTGDAEARLSTDATFRRHSVE
jgi:hypothetical protein